MCAMSMKLATSFNVRPLISVIAGSQHRCAGVGHRASLPSFARYDDHQCEIGKISEAEFTEGCNGGWVLQAEKSDKMQPSTPP
jgi:hypothetical protein